jgi:hypothetical protein
LIEDFNYVDLKLTMFGNTVLMAGNNVGITETSGEVFDQK